MVLRTYVSAFFDYRLRTANGWTAYWVPVVAIIAASLLTLAAEYLGWEVLPYVSSGAVVAVAANRICVRSGLIAVLTAAPVNNVLFYYYSGYKHPLAFHFPTSGEVSALLIMAFVAMLIAPRRSRMSGPTRLYDRGNDLPYTSENNPPRDSNGHDASLHQNGMRYWDVRPAQNPAENFAVGNEYARMTQERIEHGEIEHVPLMAWIVRDMVYSGLERARHGQPVFTELEAAFVQAMMRGAEQPRQQE